VIEYYNDLRLCGHHRNSRWLPLLGVIGEKGDNQVRGHYFQTNPDDISDRFCAECGKYMTDHTHFRGQQTLRVNRERSEDGL
jgi:hypothetical protein